MKTYSLADWELYYHHAGFCLCDGCWVYQEILVVEYVVDYFAGDEAHTHTHAPSHMLWRAGSRAGARAGTRASTCEEPWWLVSMSASQLGS